MSPHDREAQALMLAPVPAHDARGDDIAIAAAALLSHQASDGHWAFELEADATIPAEFLLLRHFLGEIEPALEARIANYLRQVQAPSHGGWPLFHGGDFNVSCSVKAYFALKAAGDSPDAPHMVRAREAILAHGGAAAANVFTRIQLALFGEVPWRAVPAMPVEIMLLPPWFPFHLNKVSYWSRTVLVPLLVLMALRPKAANPRGITIRELFLKDPERERRWGSRLENSKLASLFQAADRVIRGVEPFLPQKPRERAIERAIDFVLERLNREDGLGGIYPATANTVMMFHCLGDRIAPDHVATARRALDKLLVIKPDQAYCQPCLSPVWDTALAGHALMETGGQPMRVRQAMEWLVRRQVLDTVGDWAEKRPSVRPGGWAFQYVNPHYPDVDDTAVVIMALHRADPNRYKSAIERGVEWVLGLQSKNGGWGAFDADNTATYLNHIPFADHGALLDPPTADVTARCVSMLAQVGYDAKHPAMARALAFLRREQESDGSWFGRWGTNFIYGTWSVLCAFNAAGIDPDSPEVRHAVTWLLERQREDGGWGEDGRSYWSDQPRGQAKESAPSQTSWALLGLMAAGEVGHPAVARGIAYLKATRQDDGLWDEQTYTAVGFPRVFYLRYHGYRAHFPLWALARYRNLTSSNSKHVPWGM